jgi:hypothetical protein
MGTLHQQTAARTALLIALLGAGQASAQTVDFSFQVVSGVAAVSADAKVEIVEGIAAIRADQRWAMQGACSNRPTYRIEVVEGVAAVSADLKVEIVTGISAVTADKKVCLSGATQVPDRVLRKLKIIN